MPVIDSHQHFWKLARGDYGWLTPDVKKLYRDFLPDDLAPILKALDIDGTILVQAAPSLAETHFLLELAREHEFILGVVGWVDMASKEAPDQIAALAKHPKFCGIRPMIQDIPDDDWMLREDLSSSFVALEELNLTFDALIFPKHLPKLIKLLERHPRLRTVIDHCAKPQINSSVFASWASDLKTLSINPNVFCKLSGLLNQLGAHDTSEDLKPYMDHVFACYGKRIMWGSDFPVLNQVSHYQEWFQMCQGYVLQFHQEFYDAIFGDTAAGFYLPAREGGQRSEKGI